MQEHDGKMHPAGFADEAEMNYHPAEKEVLALPLLLKTCYTQLAGRTIHVYTRFSTLEWYTHPRHCSGGRPNSPKCCHHGIWLLTESKKRIDSLATITPRTKGSSTFRMDPQLLYARLPTSYCGFVVSFDGSVNTEKYGGYDSYSCIVWELPA
ncbi:hypothetical protein PHMEG_0005595 [Phytophthora megakarya]|uniref:Reverse transcriptase RNase H-like domain-containing protein n=1 Tax=Phytophthora megakarya TaxID=4795 RepID=A0A225WQP1_9STRA|nr:hypothetical protein PHMEG_0005589 [Phytophthora megakarya]OWZ20049.1 hypothetical protein PHMEG_0005595 [Phytophthora megakarya]